MTFFMAQDGLLKEPLSALAFRFKPLQEQEHIWSHLRILLIIN